MTLAEFMNQNEDLVLVPEDVRPMYDAFHDKIEHILPSWKITSLPATFADWIINYKQFYENYQEQDENQHKELVF